MPVEIRAATPADLPAILTLAAEAKALLKESIFQFWLHRAQAAHCRALRGDTHPDNRSMQHFFVRRGFKRCGVIYVHGGQNRDAFEKPL